MISTSEGQMVVTLFSILLLRTTSWTSLRQRSVVKYTYSPVSYTHLDVYKRQSLDNQTYQDGALSEKVKELLGLVASMVLRCDDCIKYHLGTCYELGVTTEEIYEVFSVANLVGGSICIPHTRRAAEYWDELLQSKE